jgi:hypothetical protein
MVPEDREGQIKIKIGRDSILGSHQSVSAGWLAKCYWHWCSLCSEDPVFFVFQMEESKQSTWIMG